MKPEPLRTDAALELREWRFSVIRPALAAKAGTSERASAVREIAGREHYHPVHQRRERVPERTIQRWIERYGDGDMAALGRSKRTGTAPKLILTRKWDQATAHLDPETRERIAAEVRQDVRDLWASNASLGDVMRLASERLQDLTAAAGFAGTATALVEACALPAPSWNGTSGCGAATNSSTTARRSRMPGPASAGAPPASRPWGSCSAMCTTPTR
ncbi:hypothetical protein ACFQWF_12075 [Methylorubrum suomiense]